MKARLQNHSGLSHQLLYSLIYYLISPIEFAHLLFNSLEKGEPISHDLNCCLETIIINSKGLRPLRVSLSSVQFNQSCPTLCNPMDCSTLGLSVYHQLPEFTQTHAHWVGDAIQPPISPSVVPFSSCPQSFPASGSFQMRIIPPISQFVERMNPLLSA